MSVFPGLGVQLFSIGHRRHPRGVTGHLITAYCAGLALWTLYTATFSRIDALALTVVFLCLMLVPCFLMITAFAKTESSRIPFYDWVLALCAATCAVYFISTVDEIATRISLFTPLSDVQVFFAGLLILLTLEATRRTVGLFLMLLVVLFILYNLFGDRIEGALGHGVITLNHFLDINIYTTDALFGVPVRVAATYAFLFVMFGTFLEKARGGDFFFDLSAALTGRSPGGPAKVAVVSSAFFGTMSGSPTSDVVTTGSITIPMMKRLGYRPVLAGGVEVAASTGGSLLPPVMGSAAFIMAEFTGIDYGDIVIAALLPALLYYVGIMMQVHLRAVKLGLQPLPGDAVPAFGATLKAGWIYLLPLGVLILALAHGYSPTMVAAIASVSVIAVSWLNPKARLGPKAIYEALADTTVRMLGVTGACAAAGLVIGGITMTGLASKFSFMAFTLAGDWTFVALLLSAIVTIILGLGMPTPSAYVLAAVLIGPTLVNDFGIPLLSAHLFLMYFAVMSAMTPPVAVAAYAAAAIAQANPLAIAVTAVKFSFVAFVIPFSFIYAPDVLALRLEPIVILHAGSVVAGTVVLAIAMEGFFRHAITTPVRLLLLSSGLLLFSSSPVASIAGILFSSAVLAWQLRKRPVTLP
ncbi:MAG: TRAP transporter fused permease subunit [Hyphomicrobiales bacterium]|nr:TRAP transporter fused permease subunit [Hyphomicrobiales bacterium]